MKRAAQWRRMLGGNVMIWAFSAVSGAGPLAIMEGKMNSQVHQDILLQYNDAKPQSKFTSK